jgi:hypothetical protein
MSDWSTIASLSTAGGTLVLALATFASVRSANRAARASELAVQSRLRPLLIPSRMGEPEEKVGFMDEKWYVIPGGGAIAEVGDDAIYLVLSLRNVGTGIGVLDRWCVYGERLLGDVEHGDPTTFRRLTRDLYVPPADRGFWQGALRDPSDPDFEPVRDAIKERRQFTVELLYSDYEGGQRMISRFALTPGHEDRWIGISSRHWNLDRPEPR